MSFVSLDSVEELVAAAARAGLFVTPDSDALDTMGLDFLVVHGRDAAGTRWIVRSPRRPDVAATSLVEARALQFVASRLARCGVAVPDWRVHTPEVIAYPRLGGQPAISLDSGAPVWHVIDPSAPNDPFVASLATILHAFAMSSPDEGRAAGVRVKTIADERRTVADGIAAGRELLDPPAELVARWERWLADADAWPTHVALSHGDLHPGHLLLAPDATITGVLDWTEAAFGDPAHDLAMVKMCFGRAVLEDVAARMNALGTPVPASLLAHAVERCAAFPALGAAWAKRTGNLAIVEGLRAQLELAAAP